MKPRLALAVAAALFAISALAAPAPWYKWRSKVDGKTFCTQGIPGQGWERVGGPYRNARCEKAAAAGE